MSSNRNKTKNQEYTNNNSVRFIDSGHDYFKTMQQMIDDAVDTIHLQVYIFTDDTTGNLIADALKRAAGRKVNVYLVVDGYASQSLPAEFIQSLKKAGVHFRFFQPLLKSKYFYFGRRLHHKVLVTDTKYALVGGLNIADKYNDLPHEPAWLDFAVQAEGPIAKELCVLCWKTWKGFPKKMGLTPCEKAKIKYEEGSSTIRMRRNDWVRRKNEITKSYIEMLKGAHSHITILCSYFLPGNEMRRHLKNAVGRGVKIKVIVAGISDVVIAKNAERYIYDWLLRNKIEVYEYKENMLHGKVSLCDSEWMTIGSYNVNNLSAYVSVELNLDVIDPPFVKKVEKKFDNIIREKCVHITRARHAKTTNVFKRIIRWCSYEMVRFILYMFTFYFRQRG